MVPSSTGHHFWAGVRGDKKLGRFTLRGTASVYAGAFTIGRPSLPRRTTRLTRGSTASRSQISKLFKKLSATGSDTDTLIVTFKDIEVKALGWLVHLDAEYQISKLFAVQLFFLFATGQDGAATTNNSSAFLAISPHIGFTNIFFSGGINANSSTRVLALSGYAAKGFLVPGISLTCKIKQKHELRLTAAGLWAHKKALPYEDYQPGTFYGVEGNLTVAASFASWGKAVGQFDLLVPGNFFKEKNTVVQALVGVNLAL